MWVTHVGRPPRNWIMNHQFHRPVWIRMMSQHGSYAIVSSSSSSSSSLPCWLERNTNHHRGYSTTCLIANKHQSWKNPSSSRHPHRQKKFDPDKVKRRGIISTTTRNGASDPITTATTTNTKRARKHTNGEASSSSSKFIQPNDTFERKRHHRPNHGPYSKSRHMIRTEKRGLLSRRRNNMDDNNDYYSRTTQPHMLNHKHKENRPNQNQQEHATITEWGGRIHSHSTRNTNHHHSNHNTTTNNKTTNNHHHDPYSHSEPNVSRKKKKKKNNSHNVNDVDTVLVNQLPKSLPKTTTIQFLPNHWELIVTCLPGLESILSKELDALGIIHESISCGAKVQLLSTNDTTTTTTTAAAAATTTATMETLMMKCHLYLGSASSITLQSVQSFKARGLAELRRKTAALIPWDSLLLPTVTVKQIRVTVSKSKLFHTKAIEDRIIHGIYDALGRQQDVLLADKDTEEEESDNDNDRIGKNNDGNEETSVRLDVRLIRDEVFLSIDTSLTPLHRRGYRLETAKAPLREDLAFALLHCAGWHPAYYYSSNNNNTPHNEGEITTTTSTNPFPPRYTSLLDSFCGSGTIAIEGAAMAAGLPPGRLRPAPLAGTLLYNPKRWKALVLEASEHSLQTSNSMNKSTSIVIAASDRDEGAISATRSNATRAGVLSWMDIQCTAFSSHPWLDNKKTTQLLSNPLPTNLLIASNLPFGKRVSPASGKTSSHKKHGSSSASSSMGSSFLHLYQTLGHRINRLIENGSNVRAVFLGHDPKLIRRSDIKTGFDVGFKSQHGGMSVTALVTRFTAESTKENNK